MADVFEADSAYFVLIKNSVVRKIKDSQALHLFAILKTFANQNGEAHPSTETLAGLIGKSKRQTKYILRDLEELGLVRTFPRFRNESATSFSTERDDEHKFQTSNGFMIFNELPDAEKVPPRGKNLAPPGCEKLPPNYNQFNYNQFNYIKPSNSLTLHPPAGGSASGARVVGFDEFWDEYPRKTGEKTAQTSWQKAVDAGTSPDVLAACAHNFREEMQGVDKQWIPHASTWLNQRRWLDFQETSSSQAPRPMDCEAPF